MTRKTGKTQQQQMDLGEAQVQAQAAPEKPSISTSPHEAAEPAMFDRLIAVNETLANALAYAPEEIANAEARLIRAAARFVEELAANRTHE
jgi:hypothetical protein